MKIKSAEFVISAPNLQSCPESSQPEFAFIGRSNVGKSSLINLLTDRRSLAMVSTTPGKTKLINFFTVNRQWTLVDLPGYGFAKVAQGQRADFNVAVADFLEHRENLVCMFVLIDSKLPPQAIDLEFLRWADSAGIRFALIFTKTDQQPSKVQANIAEFQRTLDELGVPVPEILRCSAHTSKGRGEILHFIDLLLRDPNYRAADAAEKSSSEKLKAADGAEEEEEDDYVDPNDWDKIS